MHQFVLNDISCIEVIMIEGTWTISCHLDLVLPLVLLIVSLSLVFPWHQLTDLIKGKYSYLSFVTTLCHEMFSQKQ